MTMINPATLRPDTSLMNAFTTYIYDGGGSVSVKLRDGTVVRPGWASKIQKFVVSDVTWHPNGVAQWTDLPAEVISEKDMMEIV